MSLLAVLVCCTFTRMHRDDDVGFSCIIHNGPHFRSHPEQCYEPNSLVLMFTREPANTAAAQQMPIPGERDAPVGVAIEPELTLGESTHVWTLGVGSDRSLGRPKEWNGDSSGFRQLYIQVLDLVIWASWRHGGIPVSTWVTRSCGQRWRHKKRS